MPKICPIEAVIVKDNRQRQNFDEELLTELDDSITAHGLLQLPVCRQVGRDVVLVAGERRLRVLMDRYNRGEKTKYEEEWIPLGDFMYSDLGELSALAAEEAELDENIKRTDLTWQEEANAHSRLHALRSIQAEAAGRKQTLTQTAQEIKHKPEGTPMGDAVQALSQNIILSAHLNDPEVAKAKTAKEAMKVIYKKAEEEKRNVLAQQFDAEYGNITAAVAKALPHELLIGNSLDLMEGLPSETYTVLLTDPPYGINADTFGDQSGEGHSYIDSHENFTKLINVLAEESYRFCTQLAHAYVFCDPRRFDELELAFGLAGWEVWPIPLIWVKNGGMLPRPDYAPRRTYETIMFASKGEKKVLKVASDTLVIPMVRGLLHGAQKPVALYEDLLSRSASPGDRVADPFCGSGTIFPAANRLRLKATGIELSEEYAALPKLRMLRSDDYLSDQDMMNETNRYSEVDVDKGLDEALMGTEKEGGAERTGTTG